MSLPVPLSVRIGDGHITQQVQSLSFRKEAVGGVRTISLSLARPLTDISGVDPLSRVFVYDTRSGLPIAQGRLTDSGRSADSNGPRWDCVAFGPLQHASDITTPLIYADTSTEGWKFYVIELSGAGAHFEATTAPGVTTGAQGLVGSWDDGTLVATNSAVSIRYTRIYEAGMKLARLAYNWTAGVTASGWTLEAIYSTDGNWAVSNVGTADTFNTAGGTRGAVVVTNFANGRNVADIRTRWTSTSATVNGATTWAYTTPPQVEALRLDQSGNEITSGYSGLVRPHQIVADLLGRILPDIDGPNSTISQGSAYDIAQLAYPDGVTAEQVLSDLIAFVPAYRWYTYPSLTGGRPTLTWDTWPTTVRYEATLDDGGNFPLSTQTVYNRVIVKWTDDGGRTRTTQRTRACKILDDKGLVRQAVIELGSEAGTLAQAQAFGDNWLADHNVPKNAGTLNVKRAIRDVIRGCDVQPWEIEAGELVRIKGVEAYPDAFNASTNDGQGVFRIYAMDYNSDDNSASLSLDSSPREVEEALKMLLNQRSRA